MEPYEIWVSEIGFGEAKGFEEKLVFLNMSSQICLEKIFPSVCLELNMFREHIFLNMLRVHMFRVELRPSAWGSGSLRRGT